MRVADAIGEAGGVGDEVPHQQRLEDPAVDHLHVQWPDQSVQNIDNVAVDSLMIIEQRPAEIPPSGH